MRVTKIESEDRIQTSTGAGCIPYAYIALGKMNTLQILGKNRLIRASSPSKSKPFLPFDIRSEHGTFLVTDIM